MSEIVVSRMIAAPPEKVFEVFADIPNVPKIQPEIVRIEMLTEGPVGNGTRWRETRKMGSKEVTLELWISEFDSPRSYTVESEAFGTHYRTELSVRPAAVGTEARMVMRMAPKTFLAKLMGPMMAGMIRKGLSSDLETLAKAVEAG